ncbi:MAG: multicopper oxidase domain-containing protein [Desulfobulbaceae bacterium]|nr:multicopper oxidase domain-containing protein [Desulfobulbaceae bacterium]
MRYRSYVVRLQVIMTTIILLIFVLFLISGAGNAETIKPFTTPLPVPPILENLDTESGSAHFRLAVQQGSRSFFPGMNTNTFGYNGNFLGPTIRVRNGQKIKIDVINTLKENTTVHWHGLHVPAKWDGGPRQVIEAGESWHPEFTIRQPAATLWYHPHGMGLTGEQVYMGLAGLFIIEDEVSENLALPKTYGFDDFPLIIQDRRFFEDGSFAYVQGMMDAMHGVIGNHLMVNGVIDPNLDVPKGLIRLRLLNGSNSSIYHIRFADNRSFHQIATDGGFQENPVLLTSLLLSAGERSEIVIDFGNDKAGSTLKLIVTQNPGYQFEAMQFTVIDTQTKGAKLPDQLTAIDWMKESKTVKTRRFVMETMSMGGAPMRMGMAPRRLTINGKNMDIGRIDEQVKLGTTEIWEITNSSRMMMQLPHSMHLHDVQFQILDRNGIQPPPEEKGRKDTILILPGERVRIISRFADYTGVYMYHCHVLEHEDKGMMGQFEVID